MNELKADSEVDKRGKEEFLPSDEGKVTYKIKLKLNCIEFLFSLFVIYKVQNYFI